MKALVYLLGSGKKALIVPGHTCLGSYVCRMGCSVSTDGRYHRVGV